MEKSVVSLFEFVESGCRLCYKCLRHCPTKSLSFIGRQSHILDSECVFCGRCIDVCPQNAKNTKSDLPLVKAFLNSEKVIASISPTYVSAFDNSDIGHMSAALKQLGFFAVEDTSIGAMQVCLEYLSVAESKPTKNILTSACPSAVMLVEKHFPELIPCLAPVVSPMVAHSRVIRKVYGDSVKIVYIGSCISQKREAHDNDIDAVIMFNELVEWLQQEKIVPSNCIPDDTGVYHSINRLYPVPGGILRIMANKSTSKTYRPISIDGTHHLMDVLSSLDNLEGYFIEMNACPGACTGSQGRRGGVPYLLAKERVLKSTRQRLKSPQISEKTRIDLSRTPFVYRQVHLKPEKREVENAMHLINCAHLDCGSCGYSNCYAAAEAYCMSKIGMDVCTFKKRSSEHPRIVIDSLSVSAIILGDDFKVLYCNQSALTLLRTDQQSIDSILHFSPLNPPISQKDLFIPSAGITVEQIVIELQSPTMFLLLLRDMSSETRVEAEKYNSIEFARKVIEAQLKSAHEIAGLLGSTAADTKLAFDKLIEVLNPEGLP